MRTLGVTGRGRDAAAALAIDGQLVAASMGDSPEVIEDPGAGAAGLLTSPAAMACLASAEIGPDAIDHVNVVGDFAGLGALGAHKASAFDPLLADAAHACAADTCAVLVASERPASLVMFRVADNTLTDPRPFSGGAELIGAARSMAGSLGANSDSAFAALDRLAANGQPVFDRLGAAIARWEPETGSIRVDSSRVAEMLAEASDGRPERLAGGDALNVKVQTARRAVAASFLHQVATVVSEIIDDESRRAGSGVVSLGGSVFSTIQINNALRGLGPRRSSVARIPEFHGRALGAAVAAIESGATRVSLDRPSSLALGPSFGDVEIKRTLDNCRLDYVYEPDWQRLYARVSSMLGQGKIVAWFQGAAAFGPRSLGTRSILADPSSPYARHNMNEYLRQLPLDEPLPIVFAPSMAAHFGADPSSQTVVDVPVVAERRDKIPAALDSRHRARIQPLIAGESPRLAELLEFHARRTGVPGLLETNLADRGSHLVSSPRDAVRVVYSSAIDALIIGRFILMKDHWLLRSRVD